MSMELPLRLHRHAHSGRRALQELASYARRHQAATAHAAGMEQRKAEQEETLNAAIRGAAQERECAARTGVTLSDVHAFSCGSTG